MGGTFQKCTIQFGGRNRGKEDAEKLAESHTDGGNGSGLDHQEKRPAVKKSPQRPQRFPQVNVLTAGARHHGRQLAVAQGPDDGQEAGHQPGPDQQRGRIDFAAYFRRNNKDAGADHRTHDQHGGAGQSQALYQFFILAAMEVPVGCACRLRWRGFDTHNPPRVRLTVAPASRRLSRGRLALARQTQWDFTLISGKIPLLICGAPVSSQISPPPHPPPPQ